MCTHISIVPIIWSSPKEVENQGTTVHLSEFVSMLLYPPFQADDPTKKKRAMFYSSHSRPTKYC